MEENKKEYSIVGTVQIGTDEYRDLIEGIAIAKREKEETSSKYWNIYNERNKLQEELKTVKETLKKYQDFVNSDEVVKERQKTYLANLRIKELEEIENND